MLIILLSFSSSLVRLAKVSYWTKYLLLIDEKCMFRPSLINLKPVELKYYPFMISLDKCNGSCNVLSPKNVLKKTQKTQILKYLIW